MKKTENVHAGHRDRMRIRFKKTWGEDYASHELLEMMLYYSITRANTNEIAHRLMEGYDTLEEMFTNCGYADFIAVKGVGEKTALMLSVISAMFKAKKIDGSKKIFLKTPEQRCQFIIEKMKGIARHEEVLMVISLSEKMQVMNCEILETGNSREVDITAGKITKFVFRSNCSSVMLAHNHLNDFQRPSFADVVATQDLKEFLYSTGIQLVDHIIVSDDKAYSMAEHEDF